MCSRAHCSSAESPLQSQRVRLLFEHDDSTQVQDSRGAARLFLSRVSWLCPVAAQSPNLTAQRQARRASARKGREAPCRLRLQLSKVPWFTIRNAAARGQGSLIAGYLRK